MIAVNGVDIIPTIFPDKTSQVWKLPDEILSCKEALITWDFEHEGEFMWLAQLVDLLPMASIHLHMPYLPYARQDKEISNQSTFALRTFAALLNSITKLEAISFVDAHSSVAEDFIDKGYSIVPTLEMVEIYRELGCDLICFPDSGATDRYYPKLQDDFGSEFACVTADKERDPSTGNLKIKSIVSATTLKDRKILIVDDICDGGMTFVLVAKELYKEGAAEVNLFVSHGIFSKGLLPLRTAGIKRIFTFKGEV